MFSLIKNVARENIFEAFEKPMPKTMDVLVESAMTLVRDIKTMMAAGKEPAKETKWDNEKIIDLLTGLELLEKHSQQFVGDKTKQDLVFSVYTNADIEDNLQSQKAYEFIAKQARLSGNLRKQWEDVYLATDNAPLLTKLETLAKNLSATYTEMRTKGAVVVKNEIDAAAEKKFPNRDLA